MSLTLNSVLHIKKNEFNGISIEEKNLSGKINIRGKSSDKEFMKNIGTALDLVLPTEPNVRIFNNEISIIWLSPNEWLIETPEKERDKIFSLLKSKLNPERTAITDVSFNRTVLRIEGQKLSTLLSKYLVADIEKILQRNSDVAQTIFIKIPILIIKNNNSDNLYSVDIHLNRSHAKYVYELLLDGCKVLNI